MDNQATNKKRNNKGNWNKSKRRAAEKKAKGVVKQPVAPAFKNEVNKEMDVVIKDVVQAFLKVVDCVDKSLSIIDEYTLHEIPDFREAVGNMAGLGYALSAINQKFPLADYVPKEKADTILAIVDDKDFSDIDEGMIFDEL